MNAYIRCLTVGIYIFLRRKSNFAAVVRNCLRYDWFMYVDPTRN